MRTICLSCNSLTDQYHSILKIIAIINLLATLVILDRKITLREVWCLLFLRCILDTSVVLSSVVVDITVELSS